LLSRDATSPYKHSSSNAIQVKSYKCFIF